MNGIDLFFRTDLFRRNPDALARFDAERRKEEEDRLRALVGPGGSVTRRGHVLILKPGREVNLTEPAGGRIISQESKPPIRTAPITPKPPSDFPKLLLESSRISAAWRPSSSWKENQAHLLRYVRVDRRDQAGLTAVAMASEELGISCPAVRVWRGDEPTASKKWGWVCGDNLGEVNLTLDQSGRDIVSTAAHECRHIWQFKRFPHLTSEEREADARSYGKNFAERVFGNRPPMMRKVDQSLRDGLQLSRPVPLNDEALRAQSRMA